MPEISRFYGIIIRMFLNDHFPPHFHAKYNEFEAQFSIETGEIFAGEIPKPQLRMVQAWVELHRDELLKNFELLSNGEINFLKIEPLK